MSECLMFGMDCQARSMVAVTADEENVSFLVGTTKMNSDDNHVNKLFVDAEGTRLMSKSFRHPAGKIEAIAAHPTKSNILATSSVDYEKRDRALNIWNIDEDKRTLELLHTKKFDQELRCLEWETSTNRAVVVGESSLVQIYDMSDEPQLDQTIEVPEEGEIHSARWSPHYDGRMLGLTIGNNAFCLDTRTPKDCLKIAHAHPHRTLNIDFNPNLQHVVATCGADGYIRIWDTRSTSEAIKSLHPHAHWIWQVKYHPVHDQLLLSVGADACVVLSCAQSVSSETADQIQEDEDDENTIEKLQDGRLEIIEEHEDSVYACAWSAADPWTFASLSYDGRLILSKVSRKHKYALMQL